MEQTSEYATMTKDKFKKNILMGKPKSRYQLVFFSNTLHHIVEASNSTYYCYCQSQEKCKTCTIPIIFSNFKKDIENNIFDCNFLFWYYTKHCNELLFDQKKKIVSNLFRESIWLQWSWLEHWQIKECTGTLVNTGMYLSLKWFDAMKRSILIGSDVENY